MATTYQKALKKLRKSAEAQGWREKEKSCGWMLLSPDKQTKVTIHKSASDAQHAIDNAVSLMRKGGFVWEDR